MRATNGSPIEAGTATVQPDGPGMYLYWEGRKNYRTRMPAPRVLEPLKTYSYGDTSQNRVIEGDNLQTMVSLRSQYRASIDVAYLDPPYNRGGDDFRYSDKRFHDPNAESDDAVYVSNEDGGRHTKWLNYMGPRLSLVWELLGDHGVCFVSISDVELFRLGMLMDEVFGESNRIGVLVWKNAIDNNPTRIAVGHEYILCYAKRIESVPRVWRGHDLAKEWLLSTFDRLKKKYRSNVTALDKAYKAAIREHVRAYKEAIAEGGETHLVDLGGMDRYRHVDARGPWASERHMENPRPGGYSADIIHPVSGKVCKKPPNGYRFPDDKVKMLVDEDRIVFGKDHTQPVQLKRYLKDSSSPLRSVIELDGRKGANTLRALFPKGAAMFRFPKPVELMELLIHFAGDIDALVLDPFAGSGTTGHAVFRLNAQDGGNRRFILIEEGQGKDRFCRTLTAARLKAALKKEGLPGGFLFETTGKMLDRDAILALEREAIANLIMQTDVTGVGRGITRVEGKYLIGHNTRRQGIALCWNGRTKSTITTEVLRAMFREAAAMGVNKPLRVYGSTCTVGETDSFHFCQIPDEIMAALQLDENPDEPSATDLVDRVESLETARRTGDSASARR